MKWLSRVVLMNPAGWGLHFTLQIFHVLLIVGLFAAVLGDAGILVSCGFVILVVLLSVYRALRWLVLRLHPERAPTNVRRLLDSRVRVNLAGPGGRPAAGTSTFGGTIDALVDAFRRREVYARLDHAVEAAGRSWEWIGMTPDEGGARFVELLRTGSMRVQVFLVSRTYVDRALGKLRLHPKGAPVFLGAGVADLPGLVQR